MHRLSFEKSFTYNKYLYNESIQETYNVKCFRNSILEKHND